MMHTGFDFPRPLGVHDAPHIGDPECTPPARALKDLSPATQPATEDLRNLLTIVAPLSDSLIREAVERLAKSALEKLEKGTATGEACA